MFHVLRPPYVCLLRNNFVSKPLTQSCRTSFVSQPLLRLRPTKLFSKFCECESSVSQNFWIHQFFIFVSFVAKERSLLRSSSYTLVLPTLNNRHYLLTLLSLTAPLAYISTFNSLPVKFRQTNFQRLKIASPTSLHRQRDFRFSCSFLTITANMEKTHNTVLRNTNIPPYKQKRTDIYRQCPRHLCSRYSPSVLYPWKLLSYNSAESMYYNVIIYILPVFDGREIWVFLSDCKI